MPHVPAVTLPGLDPRESTVYISLVTLGPATEASIANRTDINRPAIKTLLASLTKRGVVLTRKVGRQTRYIAASPTMFYAELERVASATRQTLDGLERMQQGESVTRTIVLKGKRDIQNVFLDLVTILGRDEVFYRYIACGKETDIEGFIPNDYRPTRDKKGIQQIAITSTTMRTQPFKKGMGCLWKTIPSREDAFEYGVGEIVYRDRIVMIDYIAEEAIIIENPRLAAFQKAVHTALYRRLDERVT